MTLSRRFVVFVAIGGVCSAINLGARLLINLVTGFEAAIVLAFLVAMTCAFVLNRWLVFTAGAGGWVRQYGRFALVNVLTLVQVFALTELFARVVFPGVGMRFHPETVAHAIGLLSPLLTSYWAHQRFTFRGAPTAAMGAEA